MGGFYVDDYDLFQVCTDQIEVINYMQSLINSWGSLMEVAGGVICTDKIWWYLIEYVYKRGKWVADNPEVDLDLVAKGVDGNIISLTKLRCDEAAEILVVWIVPSGDK